MNRGKKKNNPPTVKRSQEGGNYVKQDIFISKFFSNTTLLTLFIHPESIIIFTPRKRVRGENAIHCWICEMECSLFELNGTREGLCIFILCV